MSDQISNDEIAALLAEAAGAIGRSPEDFASGRHSSADGRHSSLSAEPRPFPPGPAPRPAPELLPEPAPELIDLGGKRHTPLKFESAYDFMLTYCDEFELYDWQAEELERLSGLLDPRRSDERTMPTAEKPMLYNMVAVNGSGKDNIIIAGFILWFLSHFPLAQIRATSNTAQQIDEQTFSHCKYFAEKINTSPLYGGKIFEVIHGKITCHLTDGMALFFVTNEAGRAEGFHAKFGQPFAVIVNEAKSIDDELFGGFSRYTGWTHWIEISSAGERRGHFYRKCTDPETAICPAPLVLGKNWVRYVRDKDCAHIMRLDVRRAEIIRDFGVDSIVYKSAYLSEFSDGIANDVLIREPVTRYVDPTPDAYGMPLRAGVDLSLGGDETVVSIWQGNHRVAQRAFRDRYEPTLHFRLVEIFKEFNLLPENIVADAGGLGKPIIHRLNDAGWPVNAFNFGGSAKNKTYFLNRGAELWMFLKRAVEEKLIVLPRDDHKFIEQLTTRRYDTLSGKIKLESKPEVQARGEDSPDRVDAAVMAFAMYDVDEFYAKAKPGVQMSKHPRDVVITFEEAQRLVALRAQQTDYNLVARQNTKRKGWLWDRIK